MKSFNSIVITGASSGIGEALALDYAAPGIALALSGRDDDAPAGRGRGLSRQGRDRRCRRRSMSPTARRWPAG